MQNEEGRNMDLYILRNCSATNRLITSKDHASVQISVGHFCESTRSPFLYFALCGFVRRQVAIYLQKGNGSKVVGRGHVLDVFASMGREEDMYRKNGSNGEMRKTEVFVSFRVKCLTPDVYNDMFS
uniref:40S ribosomal protein S21-2-like n=1 Tax=Tanacetum cinerariifolium TaxID=118510 RepID=A0A6L2NNY7_TANCI|nr:40S ribosomal protein S21-2-like [Tanacetum cinerariifolium]